MKQNKTKANNWLQRNKQVNKLLGTQERSVHFLKHRCIIAIAKGMCGLYSGIEFVQKKVM